MTPAGRWAVALTTERLLLTPVTADDADILVAMFREPAVRRYLLDDEPVDRPWMDGEIATSSARFAAGGLGLWLARDRRAGGDGEAVGFGGFRDFFDPPVEQLIYGLSTRATGAGLGTELAAALLELAFRDPERQVVRASADEPNQASVRVLERLGFVRVGRGPGPRWPQLHFVRPR